MCETLRSLTERIEKNGASYLKYLMGIGYEPIVRLTEAEGMTLPCNRMSDSELILAITDGSLQEGSGISIITGGTFGIVCSLTLFDQLLYVGPVVLQVALRPSANVTRVCEVIDLCMSVGGERVVTAMALALGVTLPERAPVGTYAPRAPDGGISHRDVLEYMLISLTRYRTELLLGTPYSREWGRTLPADRMKLADVLMIPGHAINTSGRFDLDVLREKAKSAFVVICTVEQLVSLSQISL